MPKKLTQEEFEEKVQECVGDQYKVVSKYLGKRYKISLECIRHDIIFSGLAECFMRGPKDVRLECPECRRERIESSDLYTSLTCAYCGIDFRRKNSKLFKSKSGLYFCCREHKDLAQRIEHGFTEMWPSHYNTGNRDYRTFAFRYLLHKCSVCGWAEDEDILEVHHIDQDRNNNNLDNLLILCPICHRKITLGKYILTKVGIVKK